MVYSAILEYIWMDSTNEFRSKTRISNIDKDKDVMEQLPVWNYDGSSTGQADGTDSEVFLIPSVIFKDPFRQSQNLIHEKSTHGKSNYLVWCEMVDKNMVPLKNSNRTKALDIFKKFKDQEPWFGLEQEYFIIDPKTNLPLGFDPDPNSNSNSKKQGKYYCGVGADRAICRSIPETHLEYCLYAGIKICGLNGEVAPAQWEYQIGPCVGIDVSDHIWVSRYILNRIAETYGYNISYHPKPLGIDSDWNGSGCHANFSTKSMRDDNGIKHIHTAINRLSKTHSKHMESYGEHNKLRMSGRHETSSYDKFTFGRANRGASVRIPNSVLNDSKGYFEDRRPSSNCDPYLVTSLIMETCMDNLLDTLD